LLPAKGYRYNEAGAITGNGQQTYAYNLRGRLSTLTTGAGTGTRRKGIEFPPITAAITLPAGRMDRRSSGMSSHNRLNMRLP